MIPFYPFVLVELVQIAKCWVSPTVAETLTKTNFHLQCEVTGSLRFYYLLITNLNYHAKLT